MSTESWRRLRRGGLIGCVLYSSAVALLAGGAQELVFGVLVGLLFGNSFNSLVSLLQRSSRRAVLDGVVVAALLVAADILWISMYGGAMKAHALSVTVPIMALSGLFWGTILSESRARLVLTCALIGALPMPPIILVAYRIASGDRMLTVLIVLIPVMALIWAAVGWLTTRSLADLPYWACIGLIMGLVVLGIVQGVTLFSGPRAPSRPISPTQMMSTLKLLTVMGAMMGAMSSTNYLYSGGPKLFDGKDES